MISETNGDREQRVAELLAGKVLGDLDPAELSEFNELVLTDEQQQLLEELEIASAAVELAFSGEDQERLPQVLRDRVQGDASKYLTRRADSSHAAPVDTVIRSSTTDATVALDRRETKSSNGGKLREWLAWGTCAALLLLLVRPYFGGSTTPTIAMARQTLMQNATDLVSIDWAAGTTPFDNPVQGDVVWSTEEQQGYMRFVGMPVNDPTVEQYQLWIIDPKRDDEPIDGGVFDIGSDGEVIIPIDSKLQVISPAAFAITIEKPGGVVVSTQERLPLLAAVSM